MPIFFTILFFSSFCLANDLSRLLTEEDTDGDKKITILDKGDRKFLYEGKTISGHYALSNLLQELILRSENPNHRFDVRRIYENPVDRIQRMIRDYYWKGLTRSLDAESLPTVLPDTKVDTGGKLYLYVPSRDVKAYSHFSELQKKLGKTFLLEKLPDVVTPGYVESLNGKHGLLALEPGEPYVVPGGRFNEMYGWDSYFESVGLILDGREDLVISMIRNFTYEITHYGKILNANRTYYLNRSQPPFFTSLIRLALVGKKKPDWLEDAVAAAMKEYETVWMGTDRLTSTGLSRYFGKGQGIPPEVEPGHYDDILSPYAARAGMKVPDYRKKYEAGSLKEPELDEFFLHDACVRESGHDTTYRFRFAGKDSCADFVTVDLNALLYKTELDLSYLVKRYFGGVFEGRFAAFYKERAEKRKELMLKYLWDEKKGYFFDYHVPSGKKSDYLSATGLYPLWIREGKILGKKDAQRVINFALKHLEGPGGIFATARESREAFGEAHERQWEWPNGWAPHQMIAWEALRNQGRNQDAERLISKWLLMISENARDYNGTIPEKFDVEKRSHKVFAEYGNVGTEFSYITREGFGWMNASFQQGLHLLSPRGRSKLKASAR